MTIKKITKWFSRESVCVYGKRGAGKDVLFGNVIARRRLPYISNQDYGGIRYELDFKALDCGGNTYKNFLTGELHPYVFPYPDKTDVYISDVGVYLPAQYCNELNRDCKELTVFQALSRHLGDCSTHFNTQALNRAWDKLREQSDIYIRCRRCKILFGIVFQYITVYDKYESALAKIEPFRLKLPLFASKEMRLSADIARQQFTNTHGSVKSYLLIYRNRSKHNTRGFKAMLDITERM